MTFFRGDLTSDAPLITERYSQWVARSERMLFDATNGTLDGLDVPDAAYYFGLSYEPGRSVLLVFSDRSARDVEYSQAKTLGGPSRLAYPHQSSGKLDLSLGIRALEKMWDAPVRVVDRRSS